MAMAGSGVLPAEVDVAVVGAGFSGLYMLYRLRGLGLRTVVFDDAGDVGGTWYWNRYPGARCDVPTTDYAYSFDARLEEDWVWSEKYATQPEILAYLRHVADRYDLRRDIRFGTRITAAAWDEAARRWRLRTGDGNEVSCRYYIMASGCLSLPKAPDIDGVDRYRGEVYLTGRWPHDRVDFSGKRVAVVGTGSSGIQCIPLIAREATRLTVFQRTPNFSVPARTAPPPADRVTQLATDRDGYREAARWSRGGVPRELTDVSGVTAPELLRRERFEAAWQAGELFAILGVFSDQGVNAVSNDHVAEMIREKIRAVVSDADVADALCPKDYPFGTKRPCLDSSYFETFNLPHVRLVDLRRTPIAAVTEAGIDTAGESFEFDAIVFATGFDAMTGPLVSVAVTGTDGVTLEDKWQHGPVTYLGLMTTGVPHLLHDHRPAEPVGAVEHGGLDRAARRLDRRLPAAPAGGESGPDRADSAGRGGLGAAQPGLRRHHAVPAGELLVHGGQRAGEAEGLPAVRRRRGRLPPGLRRGGREGLCGVQARRAGRVTVQRRSDPATPAGHGDGAGSRGFAGAAPDRDHERRRCPGLLGGHLRQPAPGPGGRRDRRRGAAGPGRRPGVPALPPANGRPAPADRLLPRRRLGPGQAGLGRTALPGPLRAHRVGGGVGELPARPGRPLSRGGRRRVRRGELDSGQRGHARRHPRAAHRRWLERRRQCGGDCLPARTRRRWPGHRQPAAARPGHRLRPRQALLCQQRRRLHSDRRSHAVVLGPLRGRGRPGAPEGLPAAGHARRPPAGRGGDGRVRPSPRRGRRLRRGPRRRRCPGAAHPGPRSHPHVAYHGRRGDIPSPGPRGDRRSPGQLAVRTGPELTPGLTGPVCQIKAKLSPFSLVRTTYSDRLRPPLVATALKWRAWDERFSRSGTDSRRGDSGDRGTGSGQRCPGPGRGGGGVRRGSSGPVVPVCGRPHPGRGPHEAGADHGGM